VYEVQEQIDALLQGFRHVIPLEYISTFSVADLELLMSGMQEIDVEDMKQNLELSGFKESDDLVVWLFEVLTEFDHAERAAFVYFISGSVKVPFGGFKYTGFKITKMEGSSKSLPNAHTCFYEIEIPNYSSKKEVREKVLTAIFEGIEGFHIG